MKRWGLVALVMVVAVGGTAFAVAQSTRTANVEIRVWEDVNDPTRNYISARPEGGSWRTLGTIPIPLTDGQSGRFRYGDITLAVPLPDVLDPWAEARAAWPAWKAELDRLQAIWETIGEARGDAYERWRECEQEHGRGAAEIDMATQVIAPECASVRATYDAATRDFRGPDRAYYEHRQLNPCRLATASVQGYREQADQYALCYTAMTGSPPSEQS